MKSTSEYIDILSQYFKTTARQYGVTKMALFGSVARNEQQEGSDVDVAYEGAPNIWLRIRMKSDLERLFGCKVDIVRMRKQLSGSDFMEEIEKDLLYV